MFNLTKKPIVRQPNVWVGYSSNCRRLISTSAKKGGQKKSAQKKGGSALADLLKKKEEAANDPVLAIDSDGYATPDQYKVLMQISHHIQSAAGPTFQQ